MKRALCIFFLFFGLIAFGQLDSKNFRSKKLNITSDTINIDSISINPFLFKVYDSDGELIDNSKYEIDYTTANLIIDSNEFQNVNIEYFAYPEYLTKQYALMDQSLIIPNNSNQYQLYSYPTDNKKQFKPFDGLNTSGSLSRGVTVGNNQDAVVTSSLDLQISGQLAEGITLRASITDSNIPIQENGYTQQLNEFDRVFIELLAKNWGIQAGDVILETSNTYFANFSKKVSGIRVNADLKHPNSNTNIFGSGAIVRGKFTNYAFFGQESNQGPYQLNGPNGEQFIIILSGSETVYVNGIPLKRGENNDYIIDYNTAEVTFMPTFPIDANMRISVDFQYSDQNYNRFITHDGTSYTSDNLTITGMYYLESDAKNQPVQQDLTDDQKQILADAGNDKSKMIVPSAVEDTYSENKILYRKVIQGSVEYFEYSIDENETLYNVRFTEIGNNLGSYVLQETIAIGKIYEYVGENLGTHIPAIQLVAPNKLQVAVVNTTYTPTDKTQIHGEFAISEYDQNLFSDIDNDTNDGLAIKAGVTQTLIDRKWDLKATANFEKISENFKTVQRFRNIEFNRDWNLTTITGEQQLFNTMLTYANENNSRISYNFEQLKIGEDFNGTRHNILANIKENNWTIATIGSAMSSASETQDNTFLRLNSMIRYDFNKYWLGTKVNGEDNQIENINTNTLSPLSQRFIEYEGFFGVGDSTGVYIETGYNHRVNDSLKNNTLSKVNTAQTIFFNSRLIQNENTQLGLNANYRTVNNVELENTNSLNSRLSWNQKFLKRLIIFNLIYETTSGNLPQQEFTYVEVEPGQGYYTWIDYNGNGIKEINEFEIAQFPDEATYLRVALPSQNFIKTHNVKLSQSLNINFHQWGNKSGILKGISHFQNQAFLLIDNKQERVDEAINFNPFEKENLLGLNSSFKNSLFFNRGKQHFSTTYNLISSNFKTSLAVDDLESNIQMHQGVFIHKLGKSWLLDLTGAISSNENSSANYSNRNYDIESTSILPKISYLFSDFTSWDFYYQLKNKENTIAQFETLESQQIGTALKVSNNKSLSFTADFNLFFNDYVGDANSAVAYQMLEGLQPGRNTTWSILWQQRLTNFLDLNLSYWGRQGEDSQAVHTGNIQLRANF